MSVPWIKMRTNLLADPRVRMIAKRVGCNAVSVTGGLYMLWSLADQYTTDGRLDGYEPDDLDREFGRPGFAAALAAPEIGWLEIGTNYLKVPDFEKHNGESAKKRAQTLRRVERHRISNDDSVTPSVTKTLPDKSKSKRREEKAASAALAGTADPPSSGKPPNPAKSPMPAVAKPAARAADAGKGTSETAAVDASRKADRPPARSKGAEGAKGHESKPEHAEFRDYFRERWKARFGADYAWKHGRDDAHAKWVLDQCGRDPAEGRRIVDRFVADADPWLADRGHEIALLVSRFNRYRVAPGHAPASSGTDDDCSPGFAAIRKSPEETARIAAESAARINGQVKSGTEPGTKPSENGRRGAGRAG